EAGLNGRFAVTLSRAVSLLRSHGDECCTKKLRVFVPSWAPFRRYCVGDRPAAARPSSTALNPASPQFITNTLKPSFMRISISFGVAGNPHGTLNSLQADRTV